MKNTLKKKFKFFHVPNFFLLIVVFAFTNNSFGEVTATCDEEEGYILDSSKIKLLDFDCAATDNLCGFVVSAPLEVEGRRFKSFVLRRLECEDTVMQLNLSPTTNNGFAETSLYGTRQLMKNVEVRAVYERKENCSLHSVLKFDDRFE